jgi:hypothetical protein
MPRVKKSEASESAGGAVQRPQATRVALGRKQPGPRQAEAKAPRASASRGRKAGDAAPPRQRTRRSSVPRKASGPSPDATVAPAKAPAPPPGPPSHEEIALRAFQLYLERGGAAGDPLLDWLRAESELKAERQSA